MLPAVWRPFSLLLLAAAAALIPLMGQLTPVSGQSDLIGSVTGLTSSLTSAIASGAIDGFRSSLAQMNNRQQFGQNFGPYQQMPMQQQSGGLLGRLLPGLGLGRMNQMNPMMMNGFGQQPPGFNMAQNPTGFFPQMGNGFGQFQNPMG